MGSDNNKGSDNNHSIIASQALRAWLADIFLRLKFSEEHAHLATDVLLMADLRGIDSHGVARLSGYIRLIEAGRINPTPNLQFTQRKRSTGHLDADAAIGLISAPFAMQKALEMTHECGSGWVGISNSNHFGIAAYHAMMALPHNYIGFSTTNASPLVTPAGGAERMLGTNPICVAIPAGKELPFVMDMATSAAANGKLEIAERVNKPIPEGWALTKDGNNTQDAAALKQGGLLLPLGSDADHGYHKGYGLGAWVDIFSGVLNGANFGPWVPPFVSFLQPRADQPGKGLGHFVGCWDVDGFRDLQDFQNDMDLWIQRFKATQPAHGVKSVIIPGEPEHHQSEYRKIHGIPLVDAVVQDLINVGKQLQHPFNL
jgi:LDH2 family malate/lactate/ureidoglycolate dehydrogenase